MTTFTSYGQVPVHRQGELIQTARAFARADESHLIAQMKALLDRAQRNG